MPNCHNADDLDDLSHLFLACSVHADDCADIEDDAEDETWWAYVVRFDGEAPQ